MMNALVLRCSPDHLENKINRYSLKIVLSLANTVEPLEASCKRGFFLGGVNKERAESSITPLTSLPTPTKTNLGVPYTTLKLCNKEDVNVN